MQERFAKKLRKLRMPYGTCILNIESAIICLEADPWSFGSGYLKADLLKIITQVELKPSQIPRLRKVAIAAVDKRDCREFRWYCRLACKVQSPELKNELQQRLNSKDANVKRRARWMLDWVYKTNHQDENFNRK